MASSMTKTAQDAVPQADSEPAEVAEQDTTVEPEPSSADDSAAEAIVEEEVAPSAPVEESKPKRGSKKADAYEGWTKPQLQEELVRRGLPKSGNVPELRDRLLAND
jgi:hypothetical protein